MSLFNTNKSKAHRQKIIFLTSIFIIMLLFLKFFDITVLQHKKFQKASQANSVRKIYNNAPRGRIYDRNGLAIVDNKPTYDLKFIPVDITDDFNYQLLSELIKINEDSLKNKIYKNKKIFKKFNSVLLKRHMSLEKMSIIQEYKLDFPGLFFSEFPARRYPVNILNKMDTVHAKATHVLGYLREVPDSLLYENTCGIEYRLGNINGSTGIEKVYECDLRGKDGIEYHLYDVQGLDHGMYDSRENISAINGRNLDLTLDLKLQEYAESFKDSSKFMDDTTKASIIVMDPITGDVLTMASFPDFDLNLYTGSITQEQLNELISDPGDPYVNRATKGLYAPGSVLKPIAAAYVLDNNIINKDWTTNCEGIYKVKDLSDSTGYKPKHCHKVEGHGQINLIESIRYSCNIYYWKLAEKITFDDWCNTVKTFGFNKITNIDLPGEYKGIIPDRKYMNNKYPPIKGVGQWSAPGALFNNIIGQGDILVTPLQIIQMTNLFATQGNTFEPHLKLNKDVRQVTLDLKESTWQTINQGMWEVVNNPVGTGKIAKNNNFEVWGKTGTSQTGGGRANHSWFTGYAILENNHIVSVVVMIEYGGYGSQKAAEIAGNLFNYYNTIKINDENN